MAEKREKKFITFKEQAHLDYLKDAFNSVLVVACFMFLTIPLFQVYSNNLLKGVDADWAICLKIFLKTLYPSVGLYLPFLIFSILKTKTSGVGFRTGKGTANPLHFLFGIITATGLAITLNAFGNSLLTLFTEAGFTVNEARPLTGSSPLTYTVFILCSTLIPPLFQELAIRGIVVNRVRKDSYVFAIIISALINGLCYRSLLQIPYCLALGALLAWLYLKTDSLALTYTVNASAHLIMAILWTMKLDDNYLFESIYRSVLVIAAISVFVGLLLLGLTFGFKIPRKEEDGKGLKGGEATKAFFKSFALWFLILFSIFFVMIGQTGKPYIHKEIEDEEKVIEENVSVPTESLPTEEITLKEAN